MIDYSNPNLIDSEENLTSGIEAQDIAKNILDNYGGFPSGARLINVRTEKHYTSVRYERTLDGLPVDGGYISIELGKNGELRDLYKVWRTVTPSGKVQVIPATKALEKIIRGEIISPVLKCDCDVTVTSVRLAYKEEGYNVPQDYLEPMWVFSGNYDYQVSALDPANSPLPQDSLAASADMNGGGTSIPHTDVFPEANVTVTMRNTF